MIRTGTFVFAVALDATAGDPAWAPHPVRAIGAAASLCDDAARLLRIRELPVAGRVAGTITAAAIVAATYAVSVRALSGVHLSGRILEVMAAGSTLAMRSLLSEAAAVEQALRSGDLQRARLRVARIVGRDTQALNETEISRATIETLAESFCDGVVAPMCYLLLGGAPLALAYKAVNTLDSIVGHIEPPYREFGWFAARLDDFANYVPARLSACAIALAAQFRHGAGIRSLKTSLRDAPLHRSPNAGWPEAAMAGSLGVRLGGTNVYDGRAVNCAHLGAEFPNPDARDVRTAMNLVTLASSLFVAAALAVLLVRDAQA